VREFMDRLEQVGVKVTLEDSADSRIVQGSEANARSFEKPG